MEDVTIIFAPCTRQMEVGRDKGSIRWVGVRAAVCKTTGNKVLNVMDIDMGM